MAVCETGLGTPGLLNTAITSIKLDPPPALPQGGLINWGDSGCPAQLAEPWSYYQYGEGTANDWVVDQTLRLCQYYQ